MARMIRAVAGTVSLLGLTMLGASPAHAGSVARAFQVQGFYGVSCEAMFTGNLNFGLVTEATGSKTVQATLLVKCSSATSFGVWSPYNSQASANSRRMYNRVANSYVNYTLRMDAGNDVYSLIPTSSTNSGFTSASGSSTYLPGITAVVTNGQTLQAGHYQDDIVIMVSY